MAAAFPAYEKIFSFDELLTHRRMIQQMLAGRRQAQELIDLGQADILAMIPRLRNRLSAEERASLLKFGTRLLTLANSLDVSLGRWERMIELNPRRIVWDSITRNDDQTIDRVFLRLPDGNVMYLPVPEEISSELDLQRYIFDQLRRLREQAQRDRELGAEVVRTISNR
jgi:hypothetical protein